MRGENKKSQKIHPNLKIDYDKRRTNELLNRNFLEPMVSIKPMVSSSFGKAWVMTDNFIQVFKLGLQLLLSIRHDGIRVSLQFVFILECHYHSSIIRSIFIFQACSSLWETPLPLDSMPSQPSMLGFEALDLRSEKGLPLLLISLSRSPCEPRDLRRPRGNSRSFLCLADCSRLFTIMQFVELFSFSLSDIFSLKVWGFYPFRVWPLGSDPHVMFVVVGLSLLLWPGCNGCSWWRWWNRERGSMVLRL